MSDEFDAWEVTQNPGFGMAHCPVAKVSSSQPCHPTCFSCPIFHISGGPLVRKHKCCLEYSLGEKLSESIQRLSYSYRFITAIILILHTAPVGVEPIGFILILCCTMRVGLRQESSSSNQYLALQ